MTAPELIPLPSEPFDRKRCCADTLRAIEACLYNGDSDEGLKELDKFAVIILAHAPKVEVDWENWPNEDAIVRDCCEAYGARIPFPVSMRRAMRVFAAHLEGGEKNE